MKAILKSKIFSWAAIVLVIVLLGVLAYVFLPGQGKLPSLPAPSYWPTDGWQTTSPEAQGFDSAKLAEGLQSFQDKNLGIDSLLIVRNGYLVLDAYYAPYDGSFPHNMASVTKSVTGILVGIAIDQGKLQPDQRMVSFFPERSIANLDERKNAITIRDLVSMRNGMESQCFHGDEPTLDAMRSQTDWVQAALDRPMTSDPGSTFCYDSPGMHLLSAILQKATGMSELDFARQNLFEPLGIREVIWESDPQGITQGWGGLHLLPEDAAKLGYLWLHGGLWDGRQIVPDAWASDSIKAQSRLVGNEYGYGYGWWVSPIDFYALGRDGQYVRVIPLKNTVVVITSGEDVSDQVLTFLLKTLLGAKEPLPENPAGVAALGTTLEALAMESTPPTISSLPDTALAISGKTYACDDNPVEVNSVRLVFDDSEVVMLYLTRYGVELAWPVGLDGKYRLSAEGQGQRGYWEDAQTFIFESFDIGQLTRRISFNGNNLELYIPEIDLTIKCQVQNP